MTTTFIAVITLDRAEAPTSINNDLLYHFFKFDLKY